MRAQAKGMRACCTIAGASAPPPSGAPRPLPRKRSPSAQAHCSATGRPEPPPRYAMRMGAAASTALTVSNSPCGRLVESRSANAGEALQALPRAWLAIPQQIAAALRHPPPATRHNYQPPPPDPGIARPAEGAGTRAATQAAARRARGQGQRQGRTTARFVMAQAASKMVSSAVALMCCGCSAATSTGTAPAAGAGRGGGGSASGGDCGVAHTLRLHRREGGAAGRARGREGRARQADAHWAFPKRPQLATAGPPPPGCPAPDSSAQQRLACTAKEEAAQEGHPPATASLKSGSS